MPLCQAEEQEIISRQNTGGFTPLPVEMMLSGQTAGTSAPPLLLPGSYVRFLGIRFYLPLCGSWPSSSRTVVTPLQSTAARGRMLCRGGWSAAVLAQGEILSASLDFGQCGVLTQLDTRCPPKLLYYSLFSWTGERKCNERLTGRDKDRERSVSSHCRG